MPPKILLLILCCAAMPAAVAQYGVPLDCDVPEHNGDCAVYGISLVQLLANPAKYDGNRVRVVGYIHLEADNDAIYLHREDEENHLRRNGVRVAFTQGQSFEGCQDAYVLLEGVFQARASGRMALWSGAITHVTKCQKTS